MNELIKYPRTKHILGSNLQIGDENLKTVSFNQIKGKFLVIEEKIDGANVGISFSKDKELLIQSRGHFLTGGNRERHFNLLKMWANTHKIELFNMLGSRYIMYGEWMYAKHTVYYDLLPDYFMEFDIYDKQSNQFLSTTARKRITNNYNFIYSVKVLYKGQLNNLNELKNFIDKSYFISENIKQNLINSCKKLNLDFSVVERETDLSGIMEGLYIKVEDETIVKERYKFVRNSFKTTIINSESHWMNRPIIDNKLVGGINWTGNTY